MGIPISNVEGKSCVMLLLRLQRNMEEQPPDAQMTATSHAVWLVESAMAHACPLHTVVDTRNAFNSVNHEVSPTAGPLQGQQGVLAHGTESIWFSICSGVCEAGLPPTPPSLQHLHGLPGPPNHPGIRRGRCEGVQGSIPPAVRPPHRGIVHLILHCADYLVRLTPCSSDLESSCWFWIG